jgi:hypothetical protein
MLKGKEAQARRIEDEVKESTRPIFKAVSEKRKTLR